MKRTLGIASLVFLFGCTGMEQSEQDKIRQMNEQKEWIYRRHDEKTYTILSPLHREREPYPWEQGYAGRHAKITKEAFRCRGDQHNPPRAQGKSLQMVHDCGGLQKHSLPIRDGEEFIYPILLDILNYLQAKTGYSVVVTCGHRCPLHNAYADNSAYNQTSKHMIGAEVDFYVQGMQDKPEEVIHLIQQYYQETSAYQGLLEYQQFLRLEHVKLNVSTPPWYNKEILIKLYLPNEGRDFDHPHNLPYLGLQVRFDRQKGEKVLYSPELSAKGYIRY